VITGRGHALYASRMLGALLLNRSQHACPERSPARRRGVADLKLACRTESILRHLLIGVSSGEVRSRKNGQNNSRRGGDGSLY
jgi:hypothetical protein